MSLALPRLPSYEARRSSRATKPMLAFQIIKVIHRMVETMVGTQVRSWYDFGEPLSYSACLKIEDTFPLRGIIAKCLYRGSKIKCRPMNLIECQG